jgi:tape measure domain-containing protein
MANKINVVLGIDTGPFERSIARAQKQLQQFGSRLEGIGSELTQRLTLPMLAVGAAAVKSFADLEKLNKGLTAIMGSSDLAAAELQKLREVAKLPGLGLKEAVQGSINLQAVGLSADEARTTLFGFGKALAAVGKGKVELEAIQYQLTQMISKNKLLAEDYKVIQSNLPLMAKGMELAFGTNNIEAIRATGISAKEFTLRLSQALAVMPQTQNVTGGLSNAFENFTDNLFIAGAQMGAAINKALNLEGVLTKLSNAVQRAADWFSSLNPNVQKTIVIAGLAVAAIGPLLFAVGSIAKVSGIAVLGFGKLVAATRAVAASFTLANAAMLAPIVAIGLLIAGIVSAYREFEGFRKVVNGIGYALKEFAQIAKEAGQAVVAGFAELKEGNFKAAAKKFGEVIIKTNPVGIALTEGKRLQDAFKQGFEDNTDYVGKTLDKFKKTISAAKKDLGGSVFGTPTLAPTAAPTGGAGGQRVQRPQQQAETPLLTTIAPDLAGLQEFAERGLLESRLKSTSEAFAGFKIQAQEAFAIAQQSAAAAREQLIAYFDEINLKVNESGQVVVNWGKIWEGAVIGGLASLAKDVEGGISSMRKLAQSVKRAAQEIIGNFIQTGVAAAVSNALKNPVGVVPPLGLALAAFAGAAAKGLFTSVINSIAPPKLARGGMTTGLTTAIVGDNPSGKEAIIPFERMGEFLNMAGGGGATRVTGLFEVRGSDLVLVLDRAKQDQARIR